jgi:2-dehydro-3-deoxygalactonokinase
MYITIDGGTTNTRVSLFDKKVLDTVKINVGARIGLTDKGLLFDGIRETIKTLLNRNSLRESDIESIIAAGMITSEGGLISLKHLPAPAGIKELKEGMYSTSINEITSIPFSFVPGVRMYGEGYGDTDVMRGEEAELFGINALMGISGAGAYILPGSHSKLIFTDENGKIYDFFTALTGEMIAALSSGTILSASVDLKNAGLNEMLYEGYKYTLENGLNKSLFKVRILANFSGGSIDDAYSFFIGAVLCGEVEEIKKCNASKVYIGGRAQIKEAEALLIKKFTDKTVVIVPDEYADTATSVGMVQIYLFNG